LKVAERVLDVDSTLQGEKIVMKINEEAMKFIATVLIDLYSDPELAIIREYSTNALDAHIEAGVTRPIEVTLPSNLSPFFKVRDYGLGLDAEDIEDIYSQYGASTKRESDDVVGMLGLGCKSALTYTDQFTLTGIKNGICTQVSVSRDEDGGGSMTIVDHFQTDDPSGVEVIVPINRYNSFDSKSKDFFRFWEEGTVVVNGEAPKRIGGTWIADDILLTEEVDGAMVVMGNVAYPFKEEDGGRWQRHHTVSFVEIGAVHFTPSRESLQMDSTTKATLATINVRVKAEKEAALVKLINEAKTRPEAIRIATQARALGLNAKPFYKGEEIPEYIEVPKDKRPMVLVDAKKRWRSKGWSTERRFLTSYFSRTLFITGYDSDTFSPFKRQKMEQWMDEKGILSYESRRNGTHPEGQFEYVLFVDKLPLAKWIDRKNVHPWSEIKAQKIVRERQPRGDGRPTGSYEGIVAGKWEGVILAQDIDTSKPLFFRGKWDNEYQKVNVIHPDATIVTLGNNRVNKFQRDFPTAKQLTTYLAEYTRKWWSARSHEDKLWLQLKFSRSSTDIRALDASKVNDPELQHIIRLIKTDRKDLHKTYDLLQNQIQIINGYSREILPGWKSPLEKYPLLTNALRYDTIKGTVEEHAYLYINAVVAAEQEKS